MSIWLLDWVLEGNYLIFISPSLGVSTSQTQQAHTSQVLQPEEALYLRKKKKRPILHDPYTRFSALLYRRPPQEDQKAILASMDNIDLDHATLLWVFLRTGSQPCNTPPFQNIKFTKGTSQLSKKQHYTHIINDFFSCKGNSTKFQHSDWNIL